MTDYLVDLASYQHGINLAAVRAAGFTRVNIKLSQGSWYTNPYIAEFVDGARANGMDVCTFHWLDASATGAQQANIALSLMNRFGLRDGTAHQCDCEDTAKPATWTIWRDYITAMQDALQRPVINYTGDWWWTPRGWDGASVTPYLWAAPNDGYRATYPGDTSSDWYAGYGGWTDYTALQYAVSAIPGAGGGDLSKTAFRDTHVWAALTGVDAATSGGDMLKDEPLISSPSVNALQALDDLWHGWYEGHSGIGGATDIHLVNRQLNAIQAAIGALGQPTQEQIDAAVAKVMNDPAWLAKLPQPPSAADIAKAVNDDAAKRLAA